MYFAGHVTAYAMSLTGTTQLQPFSPDCGFTGQQVQACIHGYIAKVAPSGDRIVWATTFGSDGQDSIAKIALAADGSLILAGTTDSKALGLTGYQSTPGSMFVARLSADGRTILAGTYFGGAPSGPSNSTSDTLTAMRLDSSGNVYIGGMAYSDPFPTTPGAFRRDHIPPSTTDTICRGSADQFIAKFDASLSRLVFSTLAGTPGSDQVFDLAIRSDGTFYVAGADSNIRSCEHPTLAHFSADASTVLYSAILSLGPTPTGAYQVTVNDATGDAFVAADTREYIPPERGEIWRLDGRGSVVTSVEIPGGITALALSTDGKLIATGNASPRYLMSTPGAPRACPPVDDPTGEMPFLARFDPVTLAPVYQGFLNSDSVRLAAPDRLIVSGLYTSARGFAIIPAERPLAGTVTCVANAASYDAKYLSPGEIVSLFGNQIGPDTPAGAQIDAAGNVTTIVAGLQVLVNGVPAPLLYAGPGQVNFIAPFGTPQTGTVSVELRRNGIVIDRVDKFARSSHVGIFTSDSSGTGTLAVLNQDQSVNSAANPAAAGSVVSLFITGVGAMTPQPIDGARPAAPLNKPVLSVFAFANGFPAGMVYAGNAPALVEGAVQVNIFLPNPIYRDFQLADPNTAHIEIVVNGSLNGTSASGTIYAR